MYLYNIYYIYVYILDIRYFRYLLHVVPACNALFEFCFTFLDSKTDW